MPYRIKIYHGDKCISDVVKDDYQQVDFAHRLIDTLDKSNWIDGNDYRVEWNETDDEIEKAVEKAEARLAESREKVEAREYFSQLRKKSFE